MEEDEENVMVESQQMMRSLQDSSDPFSAPDDIFQGTFSLTKEVCRMLINDLQPRDIQRTSLPFGVRFFCCIYFYAQGSYQKPVETNYLPPISESSISCSIKYITRLLTVHKNMEVNFPRNSEEQMAIKERFYSKFGIKGVIGVIGCMHVAIVCPQRTHYGLFMNSKGYYSINAEAVCDDRLKILSMNARFPGEVLDSEIWITSPVRSFMCQQQGSWLLGDRNYPLEPWLMTPIADPATKAESKYNGLQIKTRNVIQRCFDVLRARFNCLAEEQALNFPPEVACNIVNACVVLHNIMIDREPEHLETLDEEEFDEESTYDIDLNREAKRVRQYIINSLF